MFLVLLRLFLTQSFGQIIHDDADPVELFRTLGDVHDGYLLLYHFSASVEKLAHFLDALGWTQFDPVSHRGRDR